MRTMRRAITVVPFAVVGALATQVRRAAHRPDLPTFPNQDPSGEFGDPGLPRLRIVALGDSSITAPGVENLDNIWLRRIALALSANYRVELISVAVGGAKSRDVVARQLDTAAALNPDVAVVSVGANDAMRGTPLPRYRAELSQIISELEAASGSIMVMGVGDLGSIPRLPPMLRRVVSRRAAEFNALAEVITAGFPRAVKAATTGPMSTAFWTDRGLFAGDMFHAGDSGHGVFAEQAMPAMRAALVIAATIRI